MHGYVVRESSSSSPAASDTKSFSKLNSCCSPTVESRAYKDEKSRVEKSADAGRLAETNQRQWLICQKSEVFDSSFSPISNAKSVLERRQSLSQTKQRDFKFAKAKVNTADRLLGDFTEETLPVENKAIFEDFRSCVHLSQLPDVGKKDDIFALRRDGLHIHRCRLEKEVQRLQAIWQQEKEISTAFETALRCKSGVSSDFGHLPVNVQELLTDIKILEAAVSNLEKQITLLLSKQGL